MPIHMYYVGRLQHFYKRWCEIGNIGIFFGGEKNDDFLMKLVKLPKNMRNLFIIPIPMYLETIKNPIQNFVLLMLAMP